MQNPNLDRAHKLEGFIKLDPDNVDLLRELADCHHRGGNQVRAIELYDHLTALSGETLVLLNAKGMALLAIGRWQDAAAVFSKAVEGDHNAAPLLFNLGYSQLASGAAREAVGNLARAAEQLTDDPRVRYLLALAHEEVGDSDKAEAELSRVIQLDPTHHDALSFSAHLQIAKGRIEQARQTLARLLEAHPRSSEALWLHGQFEMLNFNAEKALEYLRRAETIAPNDADILIAIGQANLMLQRATAARQAVARAIALDCNEPMAQAAMGWALLFEDSLAESEKYFAEALRIDPEQADALAGLALIYIGQDDLARAQEMLQRAKRIDPADAAVLLTEGAIAHKQGNPDIIRQVLDELLATNSLGQAGWTNRELIERAGQSPTGKRVAGKWARYLRRQQRKQGVVPS